MERKRLSSTKSSKKHSPKENVEKTSRTTRSKTTQNYKRIIYKEDSSSDEPTNDYKPHPDDDFSKSCSSLLADRFAERRQDNSSDDSLFTAEASSSDSEFEKRLKKKGSFKTLSSNLEIPKSKSSSLFLIGSKSPYKPIDPEGFVERRKVDSIDESLFTAGDSSSDSEFIASEKGLEKEDSSSETLTSNLEIPKSKNSSPFRFWGKIAYKPIDPEGCSEAVESSKRDGTENDDSSNATDASKDLSKVWAKWKSKALQKKQIEEIKEVKRPKVDNGGQYPARKFNDD